MSKNTRQARWNERIIMEKGTAGERGVLPPAVEPEIVRQTGDVLSVLPHAMLRECPPALPEIGQAEVLRHYTRLSQEVLGTDVSIDIGKGTCTLKYSPKVNEQLARQPEIADIHPLQPDETVQGILQVMFEFEQIMKQISGMQRFSFQPGGGSQAIYTNARVIKAYHESRGEGDQRNEIITTVFSHPVNAACAATAGFRVITLEPGPRGYPEADAFRAVVSERTAGMLITNPEDTGIFNPYIEEIVRVVADAGGISAYDQANANGILGITRARECGFDLCHFNLHKTFSSPHGSGGPGAGAVGASERVMEFLPVPLVAYDGERYYLDYQRPLSIGKIRAFHGVAQVVLRAYAWVMSLGAQGLREVAEIAVLNNNYLMKKVLEIPGFSIPYPKEQRIEQVRYSLEQLKRDTGVSTDDMRRRVAEHVTHYWTAHHPVRIPEPTTMEPTESYSKAEIDEFVSIIRKVAAEAYTNPEIFKGAPHDGIISRIDESALDDPARWALTWRAYVRKHGNHR